VKLEMLGHIIAIKNIGVPSAEDMNLDSFFTILSCRFGFCES